MAPTRHGVHIEIVRVRVRNDICKEIRQGHAFARALHQGAAHVHAAGHTVAACARARPGIRGAIRDEARGIASAEVHDWWTTAERGLLRLWRAATLAAVNVCRDDLGMD